MKFIGIATTTPIIATSDGELITLPRDGSALYDYVFNYLEGDDLVILVERHREQEETMGEFINGMTFAIISLAIEKKGFISIAIDSHWIQKYVCPKECCKDIGYLGKLVHSMKKHYKVDAHDRASAKALALVEMGKGIIDENNPAKLKILHQALLDAGFASLLSCEGE